MKVTSSGVITHVHVPLQLSSYSLAFYYRNVPDFTYSSIRKYKSAVSFSCFFTVSIAYLEDKMIVSLSFVQKIQTILTPTAG